MAGREPARYSDGSRTLAKPNVRSCSKNWPKASVSQLWPKDFPLAARPSCGRETTVLSPFWLRLRQQRRNTNESGSHSRISRRLSGDAVLSAESRLWLHQDRQDCPDIGRRFGRLPFSCRGRRPPLCCPRGGPGEPLTQSAPIWFDADRGGGGHFAESSLPR